VVGKRDLSPLSGPTSDAFALAFLRIIPGFFGNGPPAVLRSATLRLRFQIVGWQRAGENYRRADVYSEPIRGGAGPPQRVISFFIVSSWAPRKELGEPP